MMPTFSTHVPKIDARYVCIVDRRNVTLAAIISSRFVRPGHYFPLFEFPGVEEPCLGQVKFEDDEYTSKIIGSEAAIKLRNVLVRLGAVEYIILAGLSAAQKSYLTFPRNIKVVEIATVEDAYKLLASVAPRRPTVSCNPSQVHQGLLHALACGAALRIDERAGDLSPCSAGSGGIVVVEATIHHAASIVALNYAYAIGASVKLVNEIPREQQAWALGRIQAWKEGGDEAARDELFAEISGRIDSLNLSQFEFATFFTDGLPYTIPTKGQHLCTYVHLSNHADHFVINGILSETEEQLHSAVVFAIDDFLDNGEAALVSSELEHAAFFVRPLAGFGATGFSFGYHAEHFPYGIFHIVSHGGQIGGYAVSESFMDRHGAKHVLEYDEVVGIHRVLTEKDKVAVQRKVIFKAIDGIDWNGVQRKHNQLPHYVYEDMRKQLFSKDAGGNAAKRVRKESIPLSCSVKCNDGIHQAMFRTVGGYGTPVIFNNTCWSWWGISDFFISGGARAYLGTFWPVDDAAAVTAANAFYGSAPGGNIAVAVQEANRSIVSTDDAGIYGLWGLHFSTLSKGTSSRNSMQALCDRLAMLLKMYERHLRSGIHEDDARDNAIEALRLLDKEFDTFCEGPDASRLRRLVAETLFRVAPKSGAQDR